MQYVSHIKELLFKRIKSLEAIPTGHTVNDKPIEGIEAVLIDIHSTLIISSIICLINDNERPMIKVPAYIEKFKKNEELSIACR